MNNVIGQQLEAWINDHLDLYNYAVRIGDSEWQQQIIAALAKKDEYAGTLKQQQSTRQLWKEFDQINKRMLDLFEVIRTQSPSETQLEKYRSTMELLKQRRLAIVKQIKSARPGTEKQPAIE